MHLIPENMRRLAYLLCRPSIKVFCIFAVVFASLYIFWNGCNTLAVEQVVAKRFVPTAVDCEKYFPKATQKPAAAAAPGKQVAADKCLRNEQYTDLQVRINGDKKVEGLLDTTANIAYVPFSFVKEYFEIYGQVKHEDGHTFLDWRHSTSEIRLASSKYSPTGPFLWFQHYRVEGRTRVKCVSGIENVPVSIQWSPEGYFYAIQIAQYGLSHYSLLMLEDTSDDKVKIFEDGESPAEETWLFQEEKIEVRNVFDEEKSSKVVSFSSKGEPWKRLTAKFEMLNYCRQIPELIRCGLRKDLWLRYEHLIRQKRAFRTLLGPVLQTESRLSFMKKPIICL